MATPCNCGPHECIHPSRLLPDRHCKVAEASRAPLLALVERWTGRGKAGPSTAAYRECAAELEAALRR